MAGKKGRSGRKKKNAVKPPVLAAEAPPAPAPVKQESVVQPAGDPFLTIEQDLKSKMPVMPAGEGSPEKKKAPENLVRFLCKGFYQVEDILGRAIVGVGREYAGVFVPEESILEAHVKPSCDLLEKYAPVDFLNKIDANMPEISFGITFLNAQLGFFDKLMQAKAEMQRKKAAPASETASSIPNGGKYPSPDDLRRA